MLSDVSSLTDISSEDDSFAPPSKMKKTTVKKAGQWTLKQVLKAPRPVQFSAQMLYEEILNGKIDLDPEYQREVVWLDAKQSGLIDSLLRNFYIPPVIFAFSQSDDGDEKRTCIDGKQRLTSIQRRTNQKFYYKLNPGVTGKLLPLQYQQQFAKKQIVCVEYTDLNGDSEREIFQRVQLGVALTPAERMQAIPGPWSQLVRDILGVMDEYKMSEFLEWSSTRGRDFQSVASIIFLMEKPKASYPSSVVLEKYLKRTTPPSKPFRERVVDTFAVFRQLVMMKKFASVFQKPARVSPIEFIMSVLLVDEHMHSLTLTQLADAVRKMRDDVRSKYTDIRANTKVAKTMHTFIMQRSVTNLKKDPSEKLALAECRSNPLPPPREKGKRKRVGSPSDSESEGSSEDERPLKAKVKKAPRASNAVPASTSKLVFSRVSGASTSTSTPTRTATQVKLEPKSTPRVAPTDRLAGLRAAKAKVGLGNASQAQASTQQLTNGHVASAGMGGAQTPPPRAEAVPNALNVNMDVVQSILQRSQEQTLQQQQWPGQPSTPGASLADLGSASAQIQMMQAVQSHAQTLASQPGTPITPQFPQQQHQQQPDMQPPTGASTDPRQNPHRTSTYAAPSSASSQNTAPGAPPIPQKPQSAASGGPPLPQKPQFDGFENQGRGPTLSQLSPRLSQSQSYPPRGPNGGGSASMNDGGGSSQRYESRFDRPPPTYPSSVRRDSNGAGGSGDGYRNSNATPGSRPPPTEPRRLSMLNNAEANGINGRPGPGTYAWDDRNSNGKGRGNIANGR
ncbi:hypothetical protein M0805_007632 [Coniferiporia weirii]|nr:hypothetical protein M0805_007632 [Coniferiporia weirii]